jgi:hypothetical protein
MKSLCCIALGCLIGLPVGFAQPAKESSLKVLSVKRGKEYRTMAPSDAEKDVMLVIELGGITVGEFRKIAQADLYLMAGERRFAPSIRSANIIDGKAQILLAMVVPHDVLAFKLFAGARPTVDFAAPEKIQDSIE